MEIIDIDLVKKHECLSPKSGEVKPGQAFKCEICSAWWYCKGDGWMYKISWHTTPILWFKLIKHFVVGPC